MRRSGSARVRRRVAPRRGGWGIRSLALALALAAPLGTPRAAPPDTEAADAALAADVELVLRDRGRDYLDARARLEADPLHAIPALRSRLEDPALDEAERRRLHTVLAGLDPAALVADHARMLRAASVAGAGSEPWDELLAATPEGRAALLELVGDRELELGARAHLLTLVVDTSPDPARLAPLIGHGHPALASQLWRALVARGHRDPVAARTLRTAIDERLDAADPVGEPRVFNALLGLRAELVAASDPGLEKRLTALAGDPGLPFGVRFVALRGLARSAATDPAALEARVVAHLGGVEGARGGRRAQADELLGWQALEGLARVDPRAAARVVAQLELHHDPAPRIAQAAWRHRPLDPADTERWLEQALDAPWPAIQVAALERVQTPCPRSLVRRLAGLGGPVSRGGEEDLRVARAAIGAIGRCGDAPAQRALEKLVAEEAIPLLQRGAAARALVAQGPGGVDTVIDALAAARIGALAETLAEALGLVAPGALPDRGIELLCTLGERHPNAARAARRTLEHAQPGVSCAPGGQP